MGRRNPNVDVGQQLRGLLQTSPTGSTMQPRPRHGDLENAERLAGTPNHLRRGKRPAVTRQAGRQDGRPWEDTRSRTVGTRAQSLARAPWRRSPRRPDRAPPHPLAAAARSTGPVRPPALLATCPHPPPRPALPPAPTTVCVWQTAQRTTGTRALPTSSQPHEGHYVAPPAQTFRRHRRHHARKIRYMPLVYVAHPPSWSSPHNPRAEGGRPTRPTIRPGLTCTLRGPVSHAPWSLEQMRRPLSHRRPRPGSLARRRTSAAISSVRSSWEAELLIRAPYPLTGDVASHKVAPGCRRGLVDGGALLLRGPAQRRRSESLHPRLDLVGARRAYY